MAQPQQTKRVRRGIVGEVRGFQERTEQGATRVWNIWTFRVERYDAAGNRLPPVPVEMRCRSLGGAINEGDWVEVPGDWQEGETLRPSYVFNITTATFVGEKKKLPASRGESVLGKILRFLFLAIIWLASLLAIVSILSASPPGPSVQSFVFLVMFLIIPVLVTVLVIAIRRRRR